MAAFSKKTKLMNMDKPDMNLGLSLSLGGIYESNRNSLPLPRSSSIIGMLTVNKNDAELAEHNSKNSLLFRSCSVPTEAEQEQRKATVMAMIARKRIDSAYFMTENGINGNLQENFVANEPSIMPSSPSEIAAWAAASAAKSPALCRALVEIKRQAFLNSSRKLGEQESLAAENGASRPHAPTQKESEFKLAEQPESGNPFKKAKLMSNVFEVTGMEVMKEMPSVTTTGDGPYGRKIEGFLYKYKQGEVGIVCVCHGRFLSPAEFVRHAGGYDVANPMRRITVCPSFNSF
ncbi:ninja-family protein 2-like isoform X2 [Mercurialis annua]|uniref:ninja-family protein 2-like isoform X2 n=1 Tax=Mercurialis annua TaxID=3986 RepID=UPI00215DE40A|nr:ninja-family protein 2-like isoform X2 [Mercurialis annua]